MKWVWFQNKIKTRIPRDYDHDDVCVA